jgi:hypothetical protein
MSSSSADFQPNRVCRFRGLAPSGKSTSAPIVGCANQYMSCVMSDGSLMWLNRTSGVGRHTGVIPEAPSLELWGVVTKRKYALGYSP